MVEAVTPIGGLYAICSGVDLLRRSDALDFVPPRPASKGGKPNLLLAGCRRGAPGGDCAPVRDC